ncbi:MAG: choice-of-anchor D domain-containing protein [Deltaproteobacteria bacterium]
MRRVPFLLLASSLTAVACSGEDPPDLQPPRDAGVAAPMVGMVELSTDTVDLGAVVVGTTDFAELTITNAGDDTVTVALSPIAGPQGAQFTRSVNIPETDGVFDLEAGGVATVTIDVAPVAEGPLLGVVVVDSCAGRCPQPILLLADGAPSGLDCPMTFDVGIANPGDCVTRDVVCTNRGNATERITAVELDPTSDEEMSIMQPALPAELAPDDTLDVRVVYCPDDVGDHSGELVVFTFEPFETEHRTALTGRGGGADLACTPTTIDYGMVGVGAAIPAFVTCTNTGFEDALVRGASDDAEFIVTGGDLVIPVGESGAIEVQLMPSSAGAKSGTLTLTTNDPDQPTIDVSLSGEAVMIGACSATIVPDTVEFGLTAVGQQREARVIVDNTGSEACLFRGVSFLPGSDDGFRVFDLPAPGTAVAAGETLELVAAFAPSSPGVAMGDLDVSFANPGTPALQVAMSGSAGPSPLQVSPEIVDFGDVALGCAEAATRTVRMQNVSAGIGTAVNVSIVPANSGFAIESASVPAQLDFFETSDIIVSFDPANLGRSDAALRIVTSGSTTPILVPLTGEGVADVARTDTIVLERRKVDVLFVVDDSCSMADSQAALSEAADIVTEAIAQREADIHVAVVTTDMEDGAKSGRFQGSPAVLDAMSTDLLGTLETRFVPGIEGSGDEQGIAAARAALTSPLVENENAGFLRDDADLAVFILSDENDFSDLNVQTSVAALRGAAGQGRLHIVSIVGPAVAPDCNGPYGIGQVGARYAELTARVGSRGTLLSYCANMRENVQAAMASILGGSSVTLSTQPVITTIGVQVGAMTLGAEDFAYEAVTNRVVLADPTIAPAGGTITVAYDARCVSPTCGDGTVDTGEQCDDMNGADDDLCVDCFDAVCGDGFVAVGTEACDDGNLVSTDACLPNCAAAACGDGVIQIGVEECDDGNTVGGDGCPSTCRFYVSQGLVSQAYVPLTNGSTLTFTGGQDPFDDGTAVVTLPFTFNYWDVPATEVYVSVNGFLSTSPITPGDSWENDAIPSTDTPEGVIAAWWDDLYLDDSIPGGADISWEVQGTAPSRVVVVQWRDIRPQNHFSNRHRRLTFQIALYETGEIQFRYADSETEGQVPSALSGSAGIEDGPGDRGIEALGCSPNCDGRPRPPRPDGFPEQSMVSFLP